MEHFISRWLVLTIAAGVMVTLLPGMYAVGEPPILGIGAFALFLALINASIKPIVHTIALPFSILSFGLIALIINWQPEENVASTRVSIPIGSPAPCPGTGRATSVA